MCRFVRFSFWPFERSADRLAGSVGSREAGRKRAGRSASLRGRAESSPSNSRPRSHGRGCPSRSNRVLVSAAELGREQGFSSCWVRCRSSFRACFVPYLRPGTRDDLWMGMAENAEKDLVSRSQEAWKVGSLPRASVVGGLLTGSSLWPGRGGVARLDGPVARSGSVDLDAHDGGGDSSFRGGKP